VEYEPTRAPAHRPGLRTAHRGATAVAACCELARSCCALFTCDERAEDPIAIDAPADDGHADPASYLADPSEHHSTVNHADRNARGISTSHTRLWI
jgi:hypothetical protein